MFPGTLRLRLFLCILYPIDKENPRLVLHWSGALAGIALLLATF